MSDEEKDQGANQPQQDSGDGDQNKPQSYGTEPVQKSLNPSKPQSYGTVRLVGSETSDSSVEESNE